MTHLEQRLAERNIQMTQSQLESLASECVTDTAIILSKGAFNGHATQADYYNRLSSNGECVVLIVRGRLPKTIMFRRANQGMRPGDMNVQNVRDLTLAKRSR